MAYRLRAFGAVGILTAIGAAHFDLVWLAAIGGVLCVVFLLACVRGLLTGRLD
jgi:hypothetical protein